MNLKAEANRLFGCREMNEENYRREIYMALENAYRSGLRLLEEPCEVVKDID